MWLFNADLDAYSQEISREEDLRIYTSLFLQPSRYRVLSAMRPSSSSTSIVPGHGWYWTQVAACSLQLADAWKMQGPVDAVLQTLHRRSDLMRLLPELDIASHVAQLENMENAARA